MNRLRTILAVLAERRRAPFAWGSADCATFAADCALALTGVDPLAGVRGRYKTALGARRILDREGWHDVAGLAAAKFEEIPVALAAVGDWAIVTTTEDGNEPSLGVVFGTNVACRFEHEVGLVPLTRASRAFRVA